MLIKAVLDNLQDVLILFSLDGASVRYINSAVDTLLGYSAESIRLRPESRFEFIHPADRVRVAADFARTVQQGTPFKTDYRAYRHDRTLIRVVEETRVITTDEGESLILTSLRANDALEIFTHHQYLKVQQAVAAILSGIDHPKLAIRSILETIGIDLGWQICEHWVPTDNNHKLRLSQIWSDTGVGATDEFITISKGLLLDRNQMTQGKVWAGGYPLWTKTVVEIDPEPRRSVTAGLGLKTSLSFPIGAGDSDGGIFTLYSQESYGIDTDLLQAVSAIGVQVAQYLQRTHLLERYAASERRFRQMFEKNEAIKLVIDPADGQIVNANNAAAGFYGYSVDQLRNMKIWQLNTISPEEARRHLMAADTEQRNRFLFNHRLASGETRQVEAHASPIELDNRNLLYATIFDITDRLRTEAALRESDERIRLVFKHTPSAIAIFDRQMRYLFATTAWLNDYRLNEQRIVGHSHFEFFPEAAIHWDDILRRALHGETVNCAEDEIKRPDGTVEWIRLIVSPWRNGADNIGGIIIFSESITDEKLSRDALRESEEKYRLLFENSLDGFAYHKIVQDQDGKPIDYIFLEVNNAFEQMTGLKRENLIGHRVTEIIPGIEHAPENWIKTYGEVALTGKTIKFEQKAPELGRNYTISAYCPKNGCFAVVFEDITQRKRAEEQLSEQQRATAALLSNLPGMAYRCLNTHDWAMQFASDGSLELTGYAPAELQIGGLISYNDLIHPDDQAMVWNEVQAALDRHEPYRLNYRLLSRDGKTKYVWEQGNGIFGENQEVIALEGFIADISDRRHAEESLQSREEHFRALIDNSSDIIALFDQTGQSIYFSPSLERVLEYEPEELTGANLFKYLHRDDRRRASEIMRQALTNAGDCSVEVRVRHKNGSWRILDAIGRNLIDNPHVGAVIFNARDITDRRNIETERSQLATAVEQAAESIVITDVKSHILYVNSAFERVSGYSREEVMGKNPRILKSGEQSPDFYREMWATLTAKRPWVGRFKNRRKNGTIYEEECTISPIRDAAGNVINYVAVKRDITKEVELEDRLRQAQKLEAVGRLASGIAHDFNNLLAGIRGFGELISQEATDCPKLRDYSEEIIRAASRAADLTTQLLAFARKGNVLLVPVDIHGMIGEAIGILKHTIDPRIEIRTELTASRPLVMGDPSQIHSAILNLGVNARDAMPNGGELTFTARNVRLDSEYCHRHSLERGPGEYISITVADTGIGIEEKYLAHIFDPFFTTKEQGKGTGLGLAGVYGCLKSHAGTVEVVSTVGKGSVFTLYFPAFETPELPSLSEFANIQINGHERILLVDDEDIVRVLAERMLTKAGYQVITCKDGEEAVSLYRTAMNAIDLVLLDLMMPKMNGRDTFAALQKFNPEVKVLIMSGFSDDDLQELMREGIIGYIQKPFQMQSFLLKIREALQLPQRVRINQK